jgi:hypothetical protein
MLSVATRSRDATGMVRRDVGDQTFGVTMYPQGV